MSECPKARSNCLIKGFVVCLEMTVSPQDYVVTGDVVKNVTCKNPEEPRGPRTKPDETGENRKFLPGIPGFYGKPGEIRNDPEDPETCTNLL
jgi:hypothetical protein